MYIILVFKFIFQRYIILNKLKKMTIIQIEKCLIIFVKNVNLLNVSKNL